MSKNLSVLVLMASIKSHYIPTFDLAEHLELIGYKVYFGTTNLEIESLIKKNGFKSTWHSGYQILANHELSFLINILKQKATYTNFVRTIILNDLYHFRVNELTNILNTINPKIILLDIFCSTDYCIIKKISPHTKIVFINPMLSTSLKSNFVHSQNEKHYKTLFFPKMSFPLNLIELKTSFLKLLIFMRYRANLKKSNLEMSSLNFDGLYSILFKGVNEISLTPQFLEITQDNNLNYWGLSISNFRKSNLNIQIKTRNQKKIYCSFGSFFDDFNSYQVNLINMLINIAAKNNIYLVCSLNPKMKEFLPNIELIKNVNVVFNSLNQLEELSNSDLFICHVGIGSIKESIYFGVPLIVFPLDLQYDQYNNGLKVNFHKIGKLANFDNLNYNYLNELINEVLTERSFYVNIANIRDLCNNFYTMDTCLNLINKIINYDNSTK